jgi:hypothetical protein
MSGVKCGQRMPAQMHLEMQVLREQSSVGGAGQHRGDSSTLRRQVSHLCCGLLQFCWGLPSQLSPRRYSGLVEQPLGT